VPAQFEEAFVQHDFIIRNCPTRPRDNGPGGEIVRVIADLCLIPIGAGVSVSREIAACERIFAEAGLKVNLHAYGTNIEGEWDEVFAAIKRCHEVVHEMGVPRVSSSLRFGTRIDREQTMDDKVRSVKEKLAR
jgi:uncharacterized protein (TIGR00106 family)